MQRANNLYWTTRDVVMWLIRREHSPEPLLSCQVASLSLVDEDRPYWICSHCGSFVRDRLSCPNCNAPRKVAQSGCGFVEIHGILPQAHIVDILNSGFQLQCVRNRCGSPLDGQIGDAIIIMDNCTVREKWIDGFDANFDAGGDSCNALVLCLLISCDARLNFEPTGGVVFDWSSCYDSQR